MATAAISPLIDAADDEDQRVVLRNVSWDEYEALLEVFEDRPGVRIAYLKGALEIMVPSHEHEDRKCMIARLLEAYALERDLELNARGSATYRKRLKERGAEPDACYDIGALKDLPDIAIEVAISRRGLNKLEIYRGLGVQEVWVWERGALIVHILRGEQYVLEKRSALIPDLDLDLLSKFIDSPNQTRTVKAYLEAVRATDQRG